MSDVLESFKDWYLYRYCPSRECTDRQTITADRLFSVVDDDEFGDGKKRVCFICLDCFTEQRIPPVYIPNDLAESVPSGRPYLPDRIPPRWVTGLDALRMLRDNLDRALASKGSVTPLVAGGKTGLRPCRANLRYSHDDPSIVLDFLDKHHVELLIVSGPLLNGKRWQTIFHPIAGAATTIPEPEA